MFTSGDRPSHEAGRRKFSRRSASLPRHVRNCHIIFFWTISHPQLSRIRDHQVRFLLRGRHAEPLPDVPGHSKPSPSAEDVRVDLRGPSPSHPGDRLPLASQARSARVGHTGGRLSACGSADRIVLIITLAKAVVRVLHVKVCSCCDRWQTPLTGIRGRQATAAIRLLAVSV